MHCESNTGYICVKIDLTVKIISIQALIQIGENCL